MTPDEREHECNRLSRETVNFMVGRLQGIEGTGLRGTADLEGEIWSWLWDHAIFKGEVPKP
jgi:hypothetical protein